MLRNRSSVRREWMASTRDEDELQRADKAGVVLAILGHVIAACAHHEVRALQDEGIPGSAERLVCDAQVGLCVSRLGVELARQCEHRLGWQQPVQRDREPRLIAFGDTSRALLEIRRRLEDEPPFFQDFFASGCQARPVAIPPKERKTEILLELLHCVGDGGRHAKQLFGRASKAAAAVNRVDDLKPFEGDSHLVHGTAS